MGGYFEYMNTNDVKYTQFTLDKFCKHFLFCFSSETMNGVSMKFCEFKPCTNEFLEMCLTKQIP